MKSVITILLCVCSVFLLSAVADPVALQAQASSTDEVAVVPAWLQIVSLVVTAAAGIAAVTPTPKDDGVVRIVRKVLDVFAFNFGHAKNKETDKK